MTARTAKIIVLFIIALWITLVAVDNIVYPGINLPFVRHVLAMDSLFADAPMHVRAMASPAIYLLAYSLIVAMEIVMAVLLWLGVWQLGVQERAGRWNLRRAKQMARFGLIVGIILYLGGFIVIGGEWFGMWMSSRWNGITSAFRFSVVLMIMLLWLSQNDDMENGGMDPASIRHASG